jgi:hypothetical protein
MKKATFSFLAFFIACTFSFAQGTLSEIDEDKYKINLPEYWGRGHKFLKILADKLPEKVEELKDKELCGDDCNPRYKIEFYITQPTMEEYRYSRILSPVNTNTRPNSFPLYVGTDGRIIPSNLALSHQNSLANTDNKWQFRSFYSFNCYLLLMDTSNKILSKIILLDNKEWWEKKIGVDLNREMQVTPASYLDANYEKLIPVAKDIFDIIENKIVALLK